MNKCETCPIRQACNECDKEFTCEEFQDWWLKKLAGRTKLGEKHD